MKSFPYILICLLLGVLVWMKCSPHEPTTEEVRTETKIKTVVKVCTLSVSPPMAPLLTLKLTDTIHIGDTVVPREQAYYEDSLYRAWVSGYRPRLDSLQIFPRTVYQTVTNDIYHTFTPKKKRWGLGLQAGYGYPCGWYVGAGISCNLFMW
ncbi:DUF6808 domain-containing protein [Bacteroides finegoldii]|jgi:hypothetical protein|uniref:DUF6808 domain-containing protein n=1 Tax=Bacteroides finegoldii TaxID=338188 RepID=UPI00205F6FB6|nr:hypothetical protein [Bacteroides finegoldii]DAQ28667.1 MAG TPA: hypothetical protein [Caudoviricetes sp.]